MLVLRVVRCERRTSLTVNAGCWHALPTGIHATLMLTPGCSPWRPKPEPATSPDAVTDGGGGATCGARVAAVRHAVDSASPERSAFQNRMFGTRCSVLTAPWMF